MATTRDRGAGAGSASRVGDGDVDLGEGWDWGAIPRLLSSACLFLCSGWFAAFSLGVYSMCALGLSPTAESRRNLITHDQITIGEPFWSTTTIEVEPADLRGVSLINASNWAFDQHGTGSSHNLPGLGNNGLILWEQTRQEWTEIRSLRPKVKQVREPVLSWNAAYESLLGSNKPFPQPIPLHEMVDFLVDIWEQEGLPVVLAEYSAALVSPDTDSGFVEFVKESYSPQIELLNSSLIIEQQPGHDPLTHSSKQLRCVNAKSAEETGSGKVHVTTHHVAPQSQKPKRSVHCSQVCQERPKGARREVWSGPKPAKAIGVGPQQRRAGAAFCVPPVPPPAVVPTHPTPLRILTHTQHLRLVLGASAPLFGDAYLTGCTGDRERGGGFGDEKTPIASAPSPTPAAAADVATRIPPRQSGIREARGMASSASAPASKGPRYAPPDPTLPKPWRGLIDGSTGYLYFWNPETKQRSEAAVSRPQYVPPSDNRARNDHSEPRSASGVNLSQSAPSTNQVSQAANGSQISTEAYRAKHEITIVGNEAPAPFMTFQSTGFPLEILREVLQAGFSAPTPIQAQSWPIAIKGRDIVAVAKTGSGKTLGYLLPGFILLKRLQHNSREGPTVLILSPTRELATQIQDEAVKFGRSSRISSTCLYGGAPKGPQLRELERGADVVVATPGRLNDILEMNRVSLAKYLILSLMKLTRMLDMGFEPQIRKIVKQIPPRRQTLMYTATWPKEVRRIASDLLNNPVQVNIGNTDQLVANKSITQHVEVIPHMEKSRRLDQILRSQDPGSKIIIFCSTKRMCDQLARNLSRQYGASAIHGDKSQSERDSVLNDFRSGRCPVLVATDVAARGLDIKDIRVVVNYDFPTGVEDYVHRIGRTGFKCTPDLVKILEGANQSVPPQLKEMALRGGYGGRSRRWASSDDSYGGQDMVLKDQLIASITAASADQAGGWFKLSLELSGNQFGDITSFHGRYGENFYYTLSLAHLYIVMNHHSTAMITAAKNNQAGDNASFPPSSSNNQSGDGLSFHERFYGSRGRDQSKTSNDGFRARSRSPPGKPVGVSNW
ncbi:unnamed protein product [Miscanthus lutarioriparius]|uniref:RNA helicase n=1 Tax=Miscanthus lutarioriparius TaxID=422564 RepID=A0A811P6E6_9POAL|nr:unnamed protein product [Miscanthus lutarioriparius]